ncbi:MAG: ferrochelatase [Flavobacteriales bacterium]
MKAVLLIQLGTPDAPEKPAVKKYLKEFLSDPRVIDYPTLKRTLLVNGIIIPARLNNSTEIYKKVWTEKGSPLLLHTEDLTKKLQEALGANYLVKYAMRYQKPSLEQVLAELEKKAIEEIIVIPLYPQYASSSTGTAVQKFMEIVSKWEVTPNFRVISRFYDNDDFIAAFAEKGNQHNWKDYDKVVFSFHGLPVRHLEKGCKVPNCRAEDCTTKCVDARKYCYRSTSYETARRIAKKMGIPEEHYTVSFQSRLGKEQWIMPYSDQIIKDLAKQGAKKLLMFSPAFVADCLETIVEIGHEYHEIFREHGGEKVQLVESLNSSDSWVKALKGMVEK